MPATRTAPFLLLDVNVLEDFLGYEAVVPVTQRERVRAQIGVLHKDIQRHAFPTVSACDRHEPGDAEFAAQSLPPHALAGTQGQRKLVEASRRHAPIIPAHGRRNPWPKIGELLEHAGQLILEKQGFDLFENPAAREIMRSFGARELILYGALFEYDLCQSALSARTQMLEVTVIEDASATLDDNRVPEVKGQLARRGVRFTKTEEVLQRMAEWTKKQARLERPAS